MLRGELEPTVCHETGGNPLVAGLIAAVGVGGAIAWYRSFSLENIWQRGVIAVLAAVGASLVGFLAALLDRFLGMIGLIIWLLFNIALGIIAARLAIKGKGTGTPWTLSRSTKGARGPIGRRSGSN